MTAMRVSEVTEEAIAGNASPAVGETRLITFGADRHEGAIDHELTRYGVRVIRARRPETRAYTALDTESARIGEMISRSDIVKLSDRDLKWLRSGDRRGDAVRWLMSRGPAILIVTDGDSAATGYIRSGSVHVRGHRVEAEDTAEWEDAFVAGLLHALAARDLLARTTDRGLRATVLEDLRGVLHDAYLCAAQEVASTAVRQPRPVALAAARSHARNG